ncbi:MAG: YqaJ viral recombinase family protein, partial [Negativicutes bacterium]|nr:YqaJ viral recombinase family protein [Negativicutes bacterium]
MSRPVILCNTLHTSEEEWLARRMDGIGGSDAAVAIGESPYSSPVKLWLEKTGQVPPDDLSDNEKVQIGKEIEDFIAGLYVKRTGHKIRRRNAIFQHPEYKFMFANVDREMIGKNEGVEIKNVGLNQAKYWQNDEIPDTYFIQIQHYCAVMNWEGCHVAALVGGQHFITKYVPRDDNFIAWMIKKEAAFWQHVIDGTMPAIDGSESCGKVLERLHPKENGQTVEIPQKAKQWLLV